MSNNKFSNYTKWCWCLIRRQSVISRETVHCGNNGREWNVNVSLGITWADISSSLCQLQTLASRAHYLHWPMLYYPHLHANNSPHFILRTKLISCYLAISFKYHFVTIWRELLCAKRPVLKRFSYMIQNLQTFLNPKNDFFLIFERLLEWLPNMLVFKFFEGNKPLIHKAFVCTRKIPQCRPHTICN